MTAALRTRRAANIIARACVGLIAVCIATGLWLHWHPAAAADHGARDEVLAVAKPDVADVLSYNYTALDQYRSRARELTTGSFQQQLSALIAGRLGQRARQDKIVTQATVPALGIVSASADRVVVLAFVNQVTTKRSLGIPLVQGSRIRLTFDKVDGHWLIAQMTPV